MGNERHRNLKPLNDYMPLPKILAVGFDISSQKLLRDDRDVATLLPPSPARVPLPPAFVPDYAPAREVEDDDVRVPTTSLSGGLRRGFGGRQVG